MYLKKVISRTAFFIGGTALLVTASCKKNNDGNDTDAAALNTEILSNTATGVCLASYQDLADKSGQLLTAVQTLNTTTTDDNLASCRALWKSIRETWERSEAWLVGPVAVDEIDPRIDTWPVDFNDLNSILSSGATLDDAYIDGLEESLKGFHPIEYLLWGQDGDKAAASFTDKEKEYLLGLSQNLKKLSEEVKDSWTGGYTTLLATAGAAGNTEYPTKKAAFEALVDGMAGICDEVANGKMKDPYELEDPTQEESPFAQNSIIDFTNNIKGIMDMYQGKFINDGKGIEDLVRHYNLALDNKIKEAHGTAVAALSAIDVPFGEAIIDQKPKVENAMAKINDLASVLDSELKPFLQQYGQ
ncbi:imelysin family protein [Agriterribacter sp.]|uniref:imelysin family protein n=1 Tax=Agriterribacter sp. TaxID=2821509 RepID=UPI002C36FA84|nr:imelysin family protein [Agriterribacter sp.]HRP56687.1 imelysin family protein [Agriterribacter sp.]